MEITLRSLVTMVHGMGFGALFLLAFSGAFFELPRTGQGTRFHRAIALYGSTCL